MIPHQAKRCEICNTRLTVHQAVTGVCGSVSCRGAAIRAAADKRREEQRRAMREAAESWLVGLVGKRAHALVVLPARTTELVATPLSLRGALIEHINEVLSERLTVEVESDPTSDAANVPEPHAALAAACATCRGYCCRNGGSRAFIDARTIARIRQEQPDLDDASILNAYERAIPAQHVEGSCVFHGPQGCTLTRAYRSQICNEFYCAPVREWFVGEGMQPGPSAIAVVDGRAVIRGVVFDDSGLKQDYLGLGQNLGAASMEPGR